MKTLLIRISFIHTTVPSLVHVSYLVCLSAEFGEGHAVSRQTDAQSIMRTCYVFHQGKQRLKHRIVQPQTVFPTSPTVLRPAWVKF